MKEVISRNEDLVVSPFVVQVCGGGTGVWGMCNPNEGVSDIKFDSERVLVNENHLSAS